MHCTEVGHLNTWKRNVGNHPAHVRPVYVCLFGAGIVSDGVGSERLAGCNQATMSRRTAAGCPTVSAVTFLNNAGCRVSGVSVNSAVLRPLWQRETDLAGLVRTNTLVNLLYNLHANPTPPRVHGGAGGLTDERGPSFR